MEKLYNENGDIAVIISYGYGAGFSTWTDINPMDKRYAEHVANWHSEDAIAYFNQILLSCKNN